MVTSPSINSASSNCVRAAVVPFSALSILIALNVSTHALPDAWLLDFRSLNGLCRLCNWARHRRLDDRQVDQRRQHAEQHRQPPGRRVRPEFLEHDATEQHAEEAADLMADKGKSIQRRKPARTEHQGYQRRRRRHGREPGQAGAAPNMIAENVVIGNEMKATIDI